MAFKLDIDTEAIEQALMKQIAEDDALFGMISEMFFEQHHNGTEVRAGVPTCPNHHAACPFCQSQWHIIAAVRAA